MRYVHFCYLHRARMLYVHINSNGDTDMTPEENLLADLAEVSHDLRNWAEDKLDEGCTAQEIIDLLREAARIAGRD